MQAQLESILTAMGKSVKPRESGRGTGNPKDKVKVGNGGKDPSSQNQSSQSMDRSKVQCYNCQECSHIKTECTSATNTQPASSLSSKKGEQSQSLCQRPTLSQWNHRPNSNILVGSPISQFRSPT